MFESMYFTMLMTPTYEKPIDTPQDILDRGLSIIYPYGYESVIEGLRNSPSEQNRALAEIIIVAKVILFYFDSFS